MTICVLGASGMLGSMLVNHLSKNHTVIATVRNMAIVDKMCAEKAMVSDVHYRVFEASTGFLDKAIEGCDIVINAIGAIPQRFNGGPLRAVGYYSLNYTLVDLLDEIGIPTIQITTDCVFSGRTGNYSEDSQKDDDSDYGESKEFSENTYKRLKFLRCSIIGRAPVDNYSLMGWLLSQESGAVVSGYINHFWNGITTLAFARICDGIIRTDSFNKLPPMQHVVPADWVTKYKLLKLLAEYFKRKDIRIEPTITEKVDRRLCTSNSYTNDKVWTDAGYPYRPTIEEMIKELAEAMK